MIVRIVRLCALLQAASAAAAAASATGEFAHCKDAVIFERCRELHDANIVTLVTMPLQLEAGDLSVIQACSRKGRPCLQLRYACMSTQ